MDEPGKKTTIIRTIKLITIVYTDCSACLKSPYIFFCCSEFIYCVYVYLSMFGFDSLPHMFLQNILA